jgi:hypothetical protein
MRKVVVPAMILLAVSAFAATGKTVDSGSFGVFIGGKRVATEKFDIQQRGEVAFASTELRTEDSGNKTTQSSELQLSSNGDLVRYTWKDNGANKAQAIVEPAHEFLVEHISAGDGKPHDTPFLLPHSTVILDDYSFAQRQILAWRYLASVCTTESGRLDCKGERAQYGILIPQQQAAGSVFLTLKGKEKITIAGAERELNRINLETDTGEWTMWFDDNNRLVRILVPSANTEILRD